VYKQKNHLHGCDVASMVNILHQRAVTTPTSIAYHLRDANGHSTQVTYRELDQRVQAIGRWLQAHGAAGERVLLLYPFGLEFIVGFYGALYAGAVAVPLYPPRPNRPDPRLLTVMADAQPAFALTTAKVLTSLTERQADRSLLEQLQWLATDTIDEPSSRSWEANDSAPTTLAVLQYTSGSTGDPKGVMVSHANLRHNAEMIAHAFGINSQSTGLIWTPFYHDMGLIGGVIQPIYTGNRAILLSPIDFLQQPSRWLQAISEERISVSGGPNFAYELCIEKVTPEACQGLDLSCWEVAFSGAEPVRAETLERFAAKFAPYGFRLQAFTPCLGMAESTLMTSCTPQPQIPLVDHFDANALAHHRVEMVAPSEQSFQNTQPLVSSGRAWLDQTFCIVHPERCTRCAPNEVGEIWIAGPSVTAGYWQRPIETAQTFGATLADTGEGPFLRSGDLGFIHKGELFVTGRLKDLIIIRGKNYYPQDIEATVASAHPALQPGGTAAFSVEEGNAERLIIVQELERTQMRTAATGEIMTAIRHAISLAHELQVSAIVLLRPGRLLKTSSGKLQRQANRRAYLQGTLDAIDLWSIGAARRSNIAEEGRQSMVTTDSQQRLATESPMKQPSRPISYTIERWITNQLADHLQIDPREIDLHRPFADYGLDSVAAVELVHSLHQWLQSTGYDGAIESTALWDFPTIATLAEQLGTIYHPIAAPAKPSSGSPTTGTSPTLTATGHSSTESELASELAQLVRILN